MENKQDKISLRSLEFFAYHGAMPEENKLGQRFVVDVDLFFSLKNAGISDRVEDTINYAEVYNTIKAIVIGEKYQLIEKLAEQIALKVLGDFALCQSAWVKVHKPGAPIAGIFGDVSVELYRERI